jgi:hypothetical protein
MATQTKSVYKYEFQMCRTCSTNLYVANKVINFYTLKEEDHFGNVGVYGRTEIIYMFEE